MSGAGHSCVKISDLGLSRTLSSSDYYRKSSNDKVSEYDVNSHVWQLRVRMRGDGAGAGKMDGAREHHGASVQHSQRRVVVWCAVVGDLHDGREAICRHDGRGSDQRCAARISATAAGQVPGEHVRQRLGLRLRQCAQCVTEHVCF